MCSCRLVDDMKEDVLNGEFEPIFMVGHSIHALNDVVDNDQIAKDVLITRHQKLGCDPYFAESLGPSCELPNTPAVGLLLDTIDEIIKSKCRQLKKEGKAWSVFSEEGESIMWHNHSNDRGGMPGLSFVYWVTVPENSGKFAAILQVDQMRHYETIVPKEGNLLLFPTYLPHLTTRNCSGKLRISISGNYYPPYFNLIQNDIREKDFGVLLDYIGRLKV